jgi:hypothetical protein
MGFYTTVSCYRAGPHPPNVSGADLADFCRRVLEMDILKRDGTWDLRLKYGRAIDQDDQPTFREEQINQVLTAVVPFNWDVREDRLTPAKVLQLLAHPPVAPNIYRAMIGMSSLRDEFTTTINHELEGNYLFLGDLSFSIDVIEIRDRETMKSFEVGWMALKVGGNGYPFPWTYEETLQRIRVHPQLRELRDICRTVWPASNQAVDPRVIKTRKQMGKYWAEPLDAPYDWYWVIQGVV